MKTIYLISEGEYSDYSVVCVCANREVAEHMHKLGHGDIEERIVVESPEDVFTYTEYLVVLNLDGSENNRWTREINSWDSNDWGPHGISWLGNRNPMPWTVTGKSTKGYDHALKNASDILAQFKNDFTDIDRMWKQSDSREVWDKIREWERQVVRHEEL